MIKLIFIGTGTHGVLLLDALAKDNRFGVALVVTAEDRPSGRKMELQPSPIKLKAHELNLPLFQPTDINSEESVAKLTEVGADVICLISYGRLLKAPILALTKHGAINVHLSVLPQYRGASCYQQALLNGDDSTGISIMKMIDKMDAGPVYATHLISIDPDDNAVILHDKLARLSAEKAPDDLVNIVAENLSPAPQDEAKASYCSKIQKSDGAIDWNESALTLHNKVRAYAGWPGSFTSWDGKRLKILKTASKKGGDGLVGLVSGVDGSIGVQTGDGILELLELQLEGKKPQSIQEFINGYSTFVGSMLS